MRTNGELTRDRNGGNAAAPLLTTREVAAFLGLSPEAVLRRWRRGLIPGYRLDGNVLRFDRADIEAWLAARRQHVAPTASTLSDLPSAGGDGDAG